MEAVILTGSNFRFVVPCLKLALFPASALLHEFMGPHYLWLAVTAALVLEAFYS